MNIKQTLIRFFALLGIVSFVVATPLYAADPACVPSDETTCCGGIETSIIGCAQTGGKEIDDTGVWGILLLVINIMTVGVGILAVAGIVYGSILYTSAGGSPDQVKKARTVIVNVVVGILAYLLMFSVLNFIIPGGVFA